MRLAPLEKASVRQVKTCTYISGRPCVGKSTVALDVCRLVPGIAHVRGDDYWKTYPDLSFEERVSKTNQDIVAALRNSDSSDVLCEWVPCRGAFVAQLRDTCVSLDRQFLHVILTAPELVLRNRKWKRDGDEDIGPELAAVPDEQQVNACWVFDTEQVETPRIAGEISKWILSNQVPPARMRKHASA